MQADKEWDLIRPERPSAAARASAGILRVTLLFGFVAIAIALFATPYLADQTRPMIGQAGYDGLDFTSTGSIGRGSNYTLRRSVLQQSPNSVCVIRENGARLGDC